MIFLAVQFQARSGQGDTMAELLGEMARLVQENEPGCPSYQVFRSREHPETFFIYEQYVNDAAFQFHLETPHFKEIIEGKSLPLLETQESFDLIAG